ncbi:bifunctional diaminohydroxyphosphoribosylaminopyrimidine deaminase/5-amino-6-(5-phosphoribosylamino)uracil reductase RibD [Exiguobacterium sp. AM39-5BH]|uniref:bifunctional diaminohydroxyphosphoribosylaminopyrimidine deaminase/5-amino-6-(5-phosphoribosylamino)uracil reductase RibD n=1 Tax=Exiguobacterium sp. AM39-5BH TaxID=2292355 RepID=UPI000FE1B7CF|nr:bifunctional diaminohydroxyphosphoribosylaminopyrimidine deaminase/5-amino-6-(5-phosphoribosylamino)uracil reductase RibD [Exiguobacterium sp. AM39-5BH]RHB49688.1 bifunctional diaminohydroxyphosphoribosylaminopyrimidine deaminase/5-amino-6-(5-phosphoribosylamino)uracil reductase RibD [Exiguobacterium sp. AM39-5BH]
MKQYMQQAIQLAESASSTGVNPRVGAVVVKDGRVVGFGAHLKAGEAHAEVHAISMAGAAAYGATMYVTLEPCSHHGKTPPCADLVVESGIKRAVIAMEDPNPLVSGQGIARLKAAGIDVEVGLLESEARALNVAFLRSLETRRPYVILKTATSLDGKVALNTGDSKWVTGTEARRDVHELRATVDAVLTGVGTVLADDPALTVRLDSETTQPLRIVLDRELRTPLSSQLVRTANDLPVLLYTTSNDQAKRDALAANGVEIADYTSLEAVLQDVYARGIGRLLVEAGPTLVTSLLDGQFVDEWVMYQSPRVFGGKGGFYRSHHAGPLDVIERYNVRSVETVGTDIKLIMRKEESDVHGNR